MSSEDNGKSDISAEDNANNGGADTTNNTVKTEADFEVAKSSEQSKDEEEHFSSRSSLLSETCTEEKSVDLKQNFSNALLRQNVTRGSFAMLHDHSSAD